MIHGPIIKVGLGRVFMRQASLQEVQETLVFGRLNTAVPMVDCESQNWRQDQLLEGVVLMLPRRIWTDAGTYTDYKLHAVQAQGNGYENEANWDKEVKFF
jgi:hypothetical protein